MVRKAGVVLLLAVLSAPGVAFAQKDVEGGKDHPLAGRFSGSVIAVYDAKEFDEYLLPLSVVSYQNNQYRFARSERLEGKVTKITYVAPKGQSTLAIVRSYEAALKQAGFETLFTSSDAQGLFLYSTWYYTTYPSPHTNRQYLLGSASPRYLAARLRRPQGDVYVAVYAAQGNVTHSENPTVQVDVVEVKAMERGLVTAKALGEELERAGRVAIYSIYFDTDKAELKPESEPTLKEIAALLGGNPRLNLYVVGHTDNVGTLPYNVDLSQRRAEAVVKALVGRQGIDAKRLRSAGAGPLAPVAPNTSDEGRAKNRRVELVAQ